MASSEKLGLSPWLWKPRSFEPIYTIDISLIAHSYTINNTHWSHMWHHNCQHRGSKVAWLSLDRNRNCVASTYEKSPPPSCLLAVYLCNTAPKKQSKTKQNQPNFWLHYNLAWLINFIGLTLCFTSKCFTKFCILKFRPRIWTDNLLKEQLAVECIRGSFTKGNTGKRIFETSRAIEKRPRFFARIWDFKRNQLFLKKTWLCAFVPNLGSNIYLRCSQMSCAKNCAWPLVNWS